MLGFWPLGGQALGGLLSEGAPTPPAAAVVQGGHYGALPRRKRKRPEEIDRDLRIAMGLEPPTSVDDEDEEILLLL